MTISLKTCVKNYVKDGQRAHDYRPKDKNLRDPNHIYTVEFWNKLLREGKLAAKNKKCNDQTLWNALVRNYKVWIQNYSKEPCAATEKRLELVEKFFTNEWIDDAIEYYKRVDPVQWQKLKFKIKATREIPEEFYLRNGMEVPTDRVIKWTTKTIEQYLKVKA